jgi:hypothetical protein
MLRHFLFSLFSAACAFAVVACGGASETGDADDPRAVAAPPATTAPPSSSPPPSTCEGTMLLPDPSGWKRAGTNPRGYEMLADTALAVCERPGLHIRSLPTARVDAFGTFMDDVPAAPYRGKRIRLRATMRAANVQGWAGAWLRVDNAERLGIAFDNMQRRALTGTRDFAEHAIVLDVAPDAVDIAFGVLVSGEGEVWAKGIVLETTGTDVPTTDRTSS